MFDARDRVISIAQCSIISEDSSAYTYIDPITTKKYVLKFIDDGLPKEDFYLIQEFRKMALLSAEPEIATVYALVSIDKGNGEPLYTGYLMDFIEGITLTKLIEGAEINFDTYTNIISQIASGIEKAINYEIIHGDLTTNNILLNTANRVKIIDFLWNDYSGTNSDFEALKKISLTLLEKVVKNDLKKSEIINQICQQSENIHGLPSRIIKAKDVAFVYSYLNEKGILILSYLFGEIDKYPSLEHPLVDKFEYVNKLFYPKAHFAGTFYPPGIVHWCVKEYLENCFHQLSVSNLCGFNIVTENENHMNSFDLLYKVNVELLYWKSALEGVNLFQYIDEDRFKSELFKDEWVGEYMKRFKDDPWY